MKREESEIKKQKFLELRVMQGKSFDSIAKELNISKQTCINWSVELSEELHNLNANKYDMLYEELGICHYNRIEFLGQIYNKMVKELENRDFSKIPTDKLILLINKMCSNFTIDIKYISNEKEDPLDFFNDERIKVELHY